MRRLIRRTQFQRSITAGTDGVVSGMWIPANSRVRRSACKIEFEGATIIDSLQGLMGGASAYFLPVTDPDSTGTMDNMWDTGVPKDSGTNTMDLDTAAVDTTPEYEPGMLKWENIYDIGSEVKKLWEEHFQSNIRNSGTMHRDPATPFGAQYIGGATLLGRTGAFRTAHPGLLCYGASSPLTTTTSSTVQLAALAEEDWGRVQFVDHMMEQAMLAVIGLIAAAASEPYTEAAQLLRTYLAPNVLETTAGYWTPETWFVTGEAIYDIEVPGEFPKGTIDLA